MAVLVAVILVAAALTAAVLDLDWLPLIPYYGVASILVTLLVVLGAIFVQVCKLAKTLHPDPLGQIRARWLKQSFFIRLLLPTIAVPLFMTGFVTLKAAATMAVPYNWDLLLTDIDHWLFGVDPWIPLHQALNRGYIPDFLQFWYLAWQLILPATLASVAIWMKPRNAAVFYTAMFMTWVVAGVLLAVLMHSAGPALVYVFDDELGRRFDPLTVSLLNTMGSESRILEVHAGLALSVGDHLVSRGGGISAMPSVHLAVTGIYVCALWTRRHWRLAALAFAATIWIGSVYFGYHYVTDGPIGFAIAIGSWVASRRLVDYLGQRSAATAPLVPALEN